MTMGYAWRRNSLLLACLAFAVASCGQPAPLPEQPVAPVAVAPLATVAVTEVRRGDLVETITVSAEVTPVREATLFFRQGGRLKNLLVASDDRVKAGQVLAEMETGDLGTQVALADIAAQKAQAKLQQAQSQGLDRFTVELAQLDYDTARISHEALRKELEDSRLVAPFDGVVTETQGKPGETLAAFTSVITIADPATLQVSAQLGNASDSARLAIGQTGTLVLDKFPNIKVPLEVVQLPTSAATLPNGSPVPADISRRFKLTPTEPLPEATEMGMLGKVTLVLREKKGVLLVKSTAVRSLGERRFVQVAQSGSKRDVDVEVGIVNQAETEIIKGLKEGDQVVDAPAVPPTPTAAPSSRGG